MIPARDDHFYITSTGRLARRLRRQFVNSRIDEGRRCWKPLRAMDLNSWLKELWRDSWPDKTEAPEIILLKLWEELAESNPPPSPLENDLGLVRLLDENFKTMIRNKIDPSSGSPSTPLVEWRRKICASFTRTLRSRNYFHPSELPLKVCREIEANRIVLPDTITLAGFDSPAPVEADLFSLLEKRCTIEYLKDQREKATDMEAIALPSPEQEVIYLAHRLVEDARSLPLDRIGVIVPDLDAYEASIERSLRDVMGENEPADHQWFNITLGGTIYDLPLIKAAMLPLLFILAGETKDLFLSLILSPYYGYWKGKRQDISRADLIWREASIGSGLSALLSLVNRKNRGTKEKIFHGNPRTLLPLFGIKSTSKKSADDWIKALDDTWSHLSFPVISGEEDTLAWNHLKEIMADLGRHLSSVRMDAHEFLSWITNMASHKKTKVGASEDAGIQIMGMVESRGLDFDKVYVLDMNDRSLPQPVRPLPLLDGTERHSVQGATAEMQYEFAEKAFQNLMLTAKDITFLRAEEENSKPLTPSPFWIGDERRESLNIWRTPTPAWLRADWLRLAHEESKKAVTINHHEPDSPIDPETIPPVLSMGKIETALACPYRFFVSTILGMEKLEEREAATSPMERGNRLHRVLASFTEKMRGGNINLEKERARAMDLLFESADEALSDCAGDPLWEVERRRWFDEPGLLISWLDEELRHRQSGWICIEEEMDFKDLKNENWPFSLKGRIDRIDHHESEGILCIDYKTGNTPPSADVISRLKAPQLPVYLLALREATIPAMEKYCKEKRILSAAYMQLKSAEDIKTSWILGTDPLLDEWTEVIAKIGRILKSGHMSADPFPVSKVDKKDQICEDCPFLTLCERGLYSDLPNAEKDGDEGTPY
ncbi:MAG: PD-(D/E)XK nuclease family protein [Deltaproteobacteria bacterium]|nr:PD-(D/E)XK nuclease family protein [Deltaproteobacteria bacterium]